MRLRALAAVLLAAVLTPVFALAASNGGAVTPLSMSVRGGETKTFSARFTNADGTPAANEAVAWANDVCGTFSNGASNANGTTDANGVAHMAFKAAPSADVTCWLTATAGNATVEFDVVTYRLDQVSIAVQTSVNFDPNGTMVYRVSAQLGFEALPEVVISARLLPGTAPAPLNFFPASANTGQLGFAGFQLTPPVPAVGDYNVEFNFQGLTKVVTITRGANGVEPLPRSISAPSPGGGTQTLTLNSASTACGFASSSAILDPRVATFRPDFMPSGGLTYTEGILSVRAEYCYQGPVTFTLTTPRALPAGSLFWMLSATKDNPVKHWHPVPVVAAGSTISFTITDGVTDSDLVGDGTITFFGGFAVAPPWYFQLQDLWWGGLGENGWGVSIVQHDEKLFAVIFAYDGNGMPTWFVMPGGQWNANRTAYTGALYSPRGAPYTAYDALRLDVGPSVGTLTLTFTDASHATLDYTINGMAGRKQITRQLFGPLLASNTRPTVGDMWWGGSQQNGWGIALLQQFGTLFGVWFTYNSVGEPTWFVMPAGAWSATDTFEGRIYRTSSSRWLAMSYASTAFRVNDVGTFRVRFTTIDTAVFEWTIEGRNGTLQLQRQAF